MFLLNRFFQFVLFIILTVLTQVGGIVYLITLFVFKKRKNYRLLAFLVIYGISNILIVPSIASIFGREKIKIREGVKVHTYFTVLTNRNYVKPEMNRVLENVASAVRNSYPEFEIHCLDANFPFFDGFPLLPHLSHNDGKKLDVSLVYERKGTITNQKPSVSGYGIFTPPLGEEINQIEICKDKGYWQYDFPKYLTLGSDSSGLDFSIRGTQKFINAMVSHREVSKVFIEPHLRSRMGVSHPKLRYHGCGAVRHDDHIHLQLK